MKRALITGITGQDGRHLSQFLADKQYQVFGLVHGQANPKIDLVQSENPALEFVEGDLRDLSSFRARQSFRAGKGGAGGGSDRHGATGEDVELRVPVGTQVLDDEEQLVADLAAPGARVVLARGGDAGRGNRRFATATRQAAR